MVKLSLRWVCMDNNAKASPERKLALSDVDASNRRQSSFLWPGMVVFSKTLEILFNHLTR